MWGDGVIVLTENAKNCHVSRNWQCDVRVRWGSDDSLVKIHSVEKDELDHFKLDRRPNDMYI